MRMSRLSTLLLSGPAPPDAGPCGLQTCRWMRGWSAATARPTIHARWGCGFPSWPPTRSYKSVLARRPPALHRDLAGDGPGLAGERVHGRRAAQARLWRLSGPARGSPGGVGGPVWSARGRAPRHLVSLPPRRPWRVALTLKIRRRISVNSEHPTIAREPPAGRAGAVWAVDRARRPGGRARWCPTRESGLTGCLSHCIRECSEQETQL